MRGVSSIAEDMAIKYRVIFFHPQTREHFLMQQPKNPNIYDIDYLEDYAVADMPESFDVASVVESSKSIGRVLDMIMH